jgi:hypothetical protein
MRDHDTGRYYQCLMYEGFITLHVLHKKPCHLGPGLCMMLEVNFREFLFYEVG